MTKGRSLWFWLFVASVAEAEATERIGCMHLGDVLRLQTCLQKLGPDTQGIVESFVQTRIDTLRV